MKHGFSVVCALVISLTSAYSPPAAADGRQPFPDPPSVLFGELYSDAALSGLVADSKHLADAIPKQAPAAIVASFRRQQRRSPAEMQRFLDTHFTFESPASPAVAPTGGLPLRQHIAELWPLLTRRTAVSDAYSSRLPLPRPYVVPGGRFTEVYYWDSYFTMLGFGPEQDGLKRDMIANFAHLIRHYGHIPNGNRSYYLSRSQPPFFFKMLELSSPADPAKAYAAHLPELKAEYDYWMIGSAMVAPGSAVRRVVGMPDGSILNRYWDDRDTPRDEAYRRDVEVALQAGRDRPPLYRDIRAAAESGWDFSSRWFADKRSIGTIRTSAIVAVDLNSILYGLEAAIGQGCQAIQDLKCARSFRMKASARRDAIRKYLWNARVGLFDDYDWRSKGQLGNISAATLYPLFFRIADPAQANRVAATVSAKLVKPGGIVTTDRTTGEQWDAPNGWAPLQWIAVMGLRNYGQTALAETIAQRWLTMVSTVYARTGKLLEKYDVVTLQPGGGGEYPLQDGFGWTNGVTIGLLGLYPDKKIGLDNPETSSVALRRHAARVDGNDVRIRH